MPKVADAQVNDAKPNDLLHYFFVPFIEIRSQHTSANR
jgi:hypothetical protein